mgnify:CR=1 FL=1
MDRRRFVLTVLAGGMLVPVAGCSGEPASGPVAIKWDRDSDARCGMVISDPRFAVQIRDPERKVWKFDDIGCAVFWLAQQSFTEETPAIEYWVSDYGNRGVWLDARRAHYLSGRKSPMGYHFAALAEPQADTLSYPQMKERLLARGK